MINPDISELKNLLSIVLFGSEARGDSDEYSDVDIFLLVEDIAQNEINEVVDKIKSKLHYRNIGISLYTRTIYNQLLSEGSMFLWHLKLEGKVIYLKENLNLFKDLQPFTKFNENLTTYENLYKQTTKSLRMNGVNYFDLSQLFFISRNIYLLSCFKLGHPTFGRFSVFSKFVECIGFSPLDWDNYKYLSKWRLNYTRGVGYEVIYPTDEELLNILEQIENLIIICRRIIEYGGNHEEIRRNKKISKRIEVK